MWPHAFRASLCVRLGGDDLAVSLTVGNVDASPLAFTGALHTYLGVDADSALLVGLEGCEYRDHRTGLTGRDSSAVVPRLVAIGRTYRDASGTLDLRSGERAVAVVNRGFENVVVWNPGADPSFHDLPPDEWREFVCVEAAQVNRAVRLDAGQRWTGDQQLQPA